MADLRTLRAAADEFAGKVRGLPTVLEVAIEGSVAGNDPYPEDLDLALIVRDLADLEPIAKCARQISRYYHAWDVFLFDPALRHLGMVCFRRECPGRSVDCFPGCGQPPHLRLLAGFKFSAREFFSSPVAVLWTSFAASQLLARKDKLGLRKSRQYPVLEDMDIKCVKCGEHFVFTGAQQKWYENRGLTFPKRCDDCIEKEYLDGLR